jgi:outer membrane cobalamin receptor
MSHRSSAFLLYILVLAAPPGARASEPSAAAAPAASGRIDGVVRTTDGAALPHVAVTLDGPGAPVVVTTGPNGGFRADALAPGEYAASVDAPGLETRSPARVRVTGGADARLDVVLSPAPVRERVVVSATRGEATLSTLGVATERLDRERIDERAAPALLSLFEEVPGVAVARTGGTGLQASAFIRGGEARYARVLVDGVAVNQPGGAYDFGTALPFELESVEVVRGAASSLYGSDALAGVVSLETRRAKAGEAPSVRGEAEGGGLAWRRYAGGTSGARGAFDWNAGVQRLQTDNEQPNGAFDETSAALSAGARIDAATDARLVLRLDDATVGTPGPTAFGRPDLDASFDRRDATGGLRLRRSSASLTHQLQLGYARTHQLSRNPEDSGSWLPEYHGLVGAYELSDYPDPAGFQNETARLSAGYQVDATLGSRHLVTAGAEAEHETGEIGNRAEELLRPTRTNGGVYLQDRVLLGARAYLTVGGRVERNGSYGTHAVPRAALAVRVRGGEDATTLRASAGLGIKEPSFLESYGESFFAKGNPDLEPERSRTFDVGLEQRLLGSRLRAAVTYFHHEYRDQIAYTVLDYSTFEGTYVNLARTRSQGLETSLEARPVAGLQVLAQYTFQDGEILESPSGFDNVYAVGRPLLRRPRHQGSVSAAYAFGRGSLGATLVRVGRRTDSDFVGIGLGQGEEPYYNPGYTRFDLRARVRVTGPLEAFVVAENLFDATYEAVVGYPALGRLVRGGLRLSLGGRP